MSIADTLIDISHESQLNEVEKKTLRLIAKDVKNLQKQIKAFENKPASVRCPNCKVIIKTV